MIEGVGDVGGGYNKEGEYEEGYDAVHFYDFSVIFEFKRFADELAYCESIGGIRGRYAGEEVQAPVKEISRVTFCFYEV